MAALGLPRYVLFYAFVTTFRVVLLVTTSLVAFNKELARGCAVARARGRAARRKRLFAPPSCENRYALREDIKRTPAAARSPGSFSAVSRPPLGCISATSRV